MTTLLDHGRPCSQAVFASVICVNQSTVSRMMEAGIIEDGGTLGQWIEAVFSHLREQAAGRLGSGGASLDLVQERAALAREQRQGLEIKNAALRGEFAPVRKLAEVLGQASSAMADRFDQLEGALRLKRPDIDDELMGAILAVVASARNEWIRVTARRVDAFVDKLLEEQDDEMPSDSFTPDDNEGLWEGAPA